MLHFFRIIRRSLLTNNKFSKYLLYAVGEIILVVIGILIALQIDTWNEERKQRETEIHYLKNLKTDLLLNIDKLDQYIKRRNSQVEAASRVLEYYEGKPLTDLEDFQRNAEPVYGWQRYTHQINTFEELVNSGNLALISNDSIKNGLLDLQTSYDSYKNGELHSRFDSEVLLYEPSYAVIDNNTWFNMTLWKDSIGPSYENRTLSRDQFQALLKDIKHKNGFAMMRMELHIQKLYFMGMKGRCADIIGMIDRELEAENE